MEPRSPALQVDSLPAELQGKPNTVKLTGDFVSETREARSELAYSSTERKKYCQSRSLCPVKLSFKNEDEIKIIAENTA